MKKIILVIILFFLSISVAYANDVEDLNLKWTDSTLDLKGVNKIDNNYYVFSTNKISKYLPSNKYAPKEYKINSNSYYYYVENKKIYLFICDTDNKMQILDSNFNVLKEALLPEGDIRINYYKPENNKYTISGTVANSEATYDFFYIEMDSNLTITKEYEANVPYSMYFIGEKNGALYFEPFVTTTSSIFYKYENNQLSEIGYSEYPTDVSKQYGFDDFLLNKRETSYYQVDPGISDATYNAILAKVTPTHSDTDQYAIVRKDGNNYLVLYQEEKSSHAANEHYIIYQDTLAYLDSSLNIKWEIDYPEIDGGVITAEQCSYWGYSTMNYLAAYSGNIIYATNAKGYQNAKIMNSNKKVLVDITKYITSDPKYMPYYMDFTSTGLFMVYNHEIPNCLKSNDASNYFDPMFPVNKPGNHKASYLDNTVPTFVYYFDVYYYVYTKPIGKGTITVNKTKVDSEELIEFTIVPDAGYVLSEVKVVDAWGNVVKFTNNKFYMPTSDVTIEATFVPKNPKTGVFISYLVIVIGGIAGIIAYLISEKRKLYKIK